MRTRLALAWSALLLACIAPRAVAQEVQPASADLPVAVPLSSSSAKLVLREGTEVPLKTVSELSSLSNKEGDRFDLTVTDDVVVHGHVVIPRGARAIGEVTRLVPKGAFGKSGKLEARLLYVAVGSHRIRLTGRSGDRGKSGTGATVAAAFAAGLFSAFVTGTSAKIPAGTAFVGLVEKDVPLQLGPSLGH